MIANFGQRQQNAPFGVNLVAFALELPHKQNFKYMEAVTQIGCICKLRGRYGRYAADMDRYAADMDRYAADMNRYAADTGRYAAAIS